jgi:uncharacterized protein
VKNSRAHFETPCGSYADLKLARYPIRFTGRPEYGDGLERTLYNTMLATRPPTSDGDYPYYSDYSAGQAKSPSSGDPVQTPATLAGRRETAR